MTALLFLAIGLAVACGVHAGVRRQGLEVNHVVLFSFGYCFYWMLPVTLGALRVMEHQQELGWWYRYFDAATQPAQRATFLVFAILIYAAFVLGSAAGARAVAAGAAGPAPAILRFDPRLLAVYLPAAAGLAAWYAWELRAQLFSGYIGGDSGAESPARGTLSAASLLLFNLVMLSLVHARAAAGGTRRSPLLLRRLFVVVYAGVAVLLLSLGMRLYVVTAMLIYLTYVSVYQARISYKRALTLATLLVVAAGAVGLVRLGASLAPLALAANIFAEPLFTSFSMLHFIGGGDFPLGNAPRFLLGDLVNLVPSAILPGKAALLPKLEDYGYTVYSPLGATSSFFSLMVNFGLVGSMLFVFGLGYSLSALRRQRAPLPRLSYAMLSGWLAFSFFRDGFSVSIVKNMLEFSLIVPWGIAATLHVATVAATRGRRRPRHPRVAARPAAHPA